jgi:hypothetical protein
MLENEKKTSLTWRHLAETYVKKSDLLEIQNSQFRTQISRPKSNDLNKIVEAVGSNKRPASPDSEEESHKRICEPFQYAGYTKKINSSIQIEREDGNIIFI